ncbi:uncharacterized protein [Cherax quadricarinatus]|uniref:uncharacterized protein n=1 Tax=Cherax quadricarinatus TaxID=27406 RepID=UPI00387EDE8D
MYGCVHMCEESVDAWKNFTKSAVKFLDMYRSLLDTYVLDFFTEDLWFQLNPQWTVILETLTPCQLADFLCRDAALKQRQVWPLSLQALRATAFAYTLPRKPVSSPAPFTNYLKQQIQDDNKVETECDGNNILESDSNFKVDSESKSPSVSMMNVLTVFHTNNIDSNVTNKCSEALSKRQNSNNTSVVDTVANNSCVVDTVVNNSCVVDTVANNSCVVDTVVNNSCVVDTVANNSCVVDTRADKDSTYCDSHQHSIHEESCDIQISNKNKSTIKSQLKLCETFETSTSGKDSVKLIQPIQQVCVNWGDTTSELSAE